MEIKFPVFILAKDCGEVRLYESIYDLQKHLEKIDIDNDEYEAWDCMGNALQLSTYEKPIWINLQQENNSDSINRLREAILRLAEKMGVTLTEEEKK